MSLGVLFAKCLATLVSPAALTVSGAFVCYKKWFDADTNDHILAATTDFMMPLYILFSLPNAYNTKEGEELWHLWPLIASPFIVVPILYLVGVACSYIIDVPHNIRFAVSGVYAFGSIGNMGILLSKSACSSFGPLSGNTDCGKSISYLCMMWLPFNIIMFLISIPLIHKESKFTGTSVLNSVFKYLLLPVPIVSLIANIIGNIPGSIWFLYDKDSVGFMLTDSAFLIGYCGIMFSQIVVGSSMTLELKDNSTIDKYKLAWIVTSRLLFTSTIVLGYVLLLWNSGLFYNDKVMAFAVLSGLSAPPTFMILIVMKNFMMDSKEVQRIILWIFLISPLSILITIFIFFSFIQE